MPLHAPTMYRRVPPLGAWPIHGGRGTPVGFWCSTEHLSPLAEHYATFSFFKVVYRPIGKVVLNLLFQGFFQVKVGEFQVLFKDCGFKGLLCHTELLLNEHSHDVTPGAPVRGGRRTRWPRILGRGVRRPYGTRGYVISQGGYNQGPPGPPGSPGTFRSTSSGNTCSPGDIWGHPGTGGATEKLKYFHGYENP